MAHSSGGSPTYLLLGFYLCVVVTGILAMMNPDWFTKLRGPYQYEVEYDARQKAVCEHNWGELCVKGDHDWWWPQFSEGKASNITNKAIFEHSAKLGHNPCDELSGPTCNAEYRAALEAYVRTSSD